MLRADGKRMPLGSCAELNGDGECKTPGLASDYFQHPLPFPVLEQIERGIDGGALL
jgi:hypothetical protein